MKILKDELIEMYGFLSYDSYDLLTNEFRKLTLEFGEEKTAKGCYEYSKHTPDLLYLLAISGNKESKKYLKLCLENISYGDEITMIALGFIALELEEGYDLIKKLLNKYYEVDYPTNLEDIYAYLIDVIHISPRALKIVEDIENDKYGDASFTISYVEEKKRRLSERK